MVLRRYYRKKAFSYCSVCWWNWLREFRSRLSRLLKLALGGCAKERLEGRAVCSSQKLVVAFDRLVHAEIITSLSNRMNKYQAIRN